MLPLTESIALKEPALKLAPSFLESRQKTTIQHRVHQQPRSADESPLPPKRKIRSARGLRRYLVQEEGVEYIPKTRVLAVPRKELTDHSVYERYLRRSTFFDRFEFDHDGRKAWHIELEKTIDPSLVSALCVNDNQMTLNSISAVLLFSAHLTRRYGRLDAQLGSSLESQEAKLQEFYQGPLPSEEVLEKIKEEKKLEKTDEALAVYAHDRYARLSFEEKLSIVQGFCSTIVDSLWIIARAQNGQPESTRIHVTGNRRSRNETFAELQMSST